jgi:nitrate/nitrite-specific signal transduction histidine kinase
LPLLSTYLDRIAQKAFRVRQKAYYVALEKQVLERSDEIRDATKRLEALSEVTDRLQKENIAVSPCDWALSRALDWTERLIRRLSSVSLPLDASLHFL